MHSKVVCKVNDLAVDKYAAIGIKPWHHMVIENDRIFVYVWDTRNIEAVIPADCINQEDITYAVIDNRMDLVCPEDASATIKQYCNAMRETMPIVFPESPMTEDEQALLRIEHY